VIAEVSPVFLDPVPRLVIDGQKILLAKPLNFFQWVWSGIPILLMFIGGMIGGFIGATAFWINTRIFRSNEIGEVEKFVLTGAVTVIVTLVWFIVLYLLADSFVR
jgi:hypothetical protein